MDRNIVDGGSARGVLWWHVTEVNAYGGLWDESRSVEADEGGGIASDADHVVSEESWQFFAFAFAALVGLAFGVLDSLTPRLSAWVPEHRAPWWLAGAKVFAFFVLGYLTLRYWLVKNFLRRVMLDIKTDRN